MKWRGSQFLIFVLFVAGSTMACRTSSNAPVPVSDVGHRDADEDSGEPGILPDVDLGRPAHLEILSPTNLLVVGERAELRARFVNADGAPAGMATQAVWSVDDEQIAEIVPDESMLHALAPGRTRLHAQAGDATTSVALEVLQPDIPTLDIVNDALVLGIPAQLSLDELEVEARDENGNRIAESPLEWESRNDSVVRVGYGLVLAVSEGDTEIRATWRGVTASLAVSVRRVERLEIVPADDILLVGDERQLEVHYYSARDERLQLDEVPIEWSADSLNIVEVDATGHLRAVGGGRAAVTARSQGKSAAAHFFSVDVRYRDIACFYDHCCMISLQDELYCWGANHSGQLGVGDTRDRYFPARVDTTSRFKSVFVGSNASCAIDTSGQLWCWGQEAYGRLGTSDLNHLRPVPVASQHAIVQISILSDSIYALNTESQLLVMGRWPPSYQNDPNPTVLYDELTVVDEGPISRFEDVSPYTLCVNRGAKIECIGTNYSRGLGQGAGAPAWYGHFVEWGAGLGIVELVGDHNVFCGRDAASLVWCSAHTNANGSLGHPMVGEGPHHFVPGRTAWSHTFERLYMERVILCGEREQHLWCWGPNTSCQLGPAPETETNTNTGQQYSYEPVFIETPQASKVALYGAGGCIIADGTGIQSCWGLEQDANTVPLSVNAPISCNPYVTQVRAYKRPG